MDRSKLYRRFRTLLIANRGEIACRVILSLIHISEPTRP